MRATGGRPRLASELAQPLPVVAVLALLFNDHVLKGAPGVPGWLTGKLSDFAGLFFFPLLLFVLADALARVGRVRHLRRRALALGCGLATALVFAAFKLHAGANALASALWGPIALDPSDLLALPMVGAAVWWLVGRDWSAQAGLRSAGLRSAVVVVAALASIATPPPAEVRNYPAWELLGSGSASTGCADAEAWVSKSGKQGVGVTLRLRAMTRSACEVRVQGAHIVIAGRAVEALELPAAVRVGRKPRHLYLPFAFDNEASWNREELAAVLTIDLALDGAPARLRREMVHRWTGPHRYDPHWNRHTEPECDEDAGVDATPSAAADIVPPRSAGAMPPTEAR